MAYADSTGHPRLVLSVDETGTPKITLRNTTGHVVWSTP
jgi:hypothetical protein